MRQGVDKEGERLPVETTDRLNTPKMDPPRRAHQREE